MSNAVNDELLELLYEEFLEKGYSEEEARDLAVEKFYNLG